MPSPGSKTIFAFKGVLVAGVSNGMDKGTVNVAYGIHFPNVGPIRRFKKRISDASGSSCHSSSRYSDCPLPGWKLTRLQQSLNLLLRPMGVTQPMSSSLGQFHPPRYILLAIGSQQASDQQTKRLNFPVMLPFTSNFVPRIDSQISGNGRIPESKVTFSPVQVEMERDRNPRVRIARLPVGNLLTKP